MSTLEEEIRDLKAEIAEYRDMMKAATTEAGDKKMYANLITESKKTLNILLQQQAQAQGE
jgi:hypothetical protein